MRRKPQHPAATQVDRSFASPRWTSRASSQQQNNHLDLNLKQKSMHKKKGVLKDMLKTGPPI